MNSGNGNVWVFVDVDGTLIDKDDAPRPFVVYFFLKLRRMGCNVAVWSAGGSAYAEQKIGMIGRKLEIDIDPYVDQYFSKSDYDRIETEGSQFFIDDAQGLLDAMKKKGHGIFKVPFYEPNINGVKDQDCWLLNAGYAVKEFVLDKNG